MHFLPLPFPFGSRRTPREQAHDAGNQPPGRRRWAYNVVQECMMDGLHDFSLKEANLCQLVTGAWNSPGKMLKISGHFSLLFVG